MTLLELMGLLKKNLKLVVVLPLICAALIGAYAFIVLEDEYTAISSMYVLARQDDTNTNLNAELAASQLVANDIATLLKSDRVSASAARALGVSDLSGFDVTVSNETTSRVMSVSVTGADPNRVAQVANALTESVSGIAQDVMEVESVNVLDSADIPLTPSGPNRIMYVLVGYFATLFLVISALVLNDIVNTKVRNADEVEELLGIPVIGRIPTVKEGR